MKHLYLFLLLPYIISTANSNYNQPLQTTNPLKKGQKYHHENHHSSHPETLPSHPNFAGITNSTNSEILPVPNIEWYNEDLYKKDENEDVILWNKYHRPAVMEGGLLSAQVPHHTLIAVDRFLKILKSLAGFAILIAISMPFIQVVTSSMLETIISYF